MARTWFRDDLVNYAASRLTVTLATPLPVSYVTINLKQQRSCDLHTYIYICIYTYTVYMYDLRPNYFKNYVSVFAYFNIQLLSEWKRTASAV